MTAHLPKLLILRHGLYCLALLALAPAQPALAETALDQSTWTEFSYEPYPLARITDDADRYPEATPQSAVVS